MTLIDPSKLIERIQLMKFPNYGTAIVAVLDMPKIEAEEIVYCKECKHRLWNDFNTSFICPKLGKYVKRDFFCAYGKRKVN